MSRYQTYQFSVSRPVARLRASSSRRGLLFRPRLNARRLQRSAARLAMPDVPEQLFLDGVTALLEADRAWIPKAESGALYIRPVLFSEEWVTSL